jgi:hypothetical protein
MTADAEAAAQRAEWCQQHAAAMAAWWYLAGVDPAIEAAVNFAAIAGTGIDQLPRAVAEVIAAAVDASDRDTIRAALEPIADRAVVADRVAAEVAVRNMTRAVAEYLSDGARERLAQRLVGGDYDFPLRCRRAAAMAALGQLRDDPELLSIAVELANRECREKPALTPSAVLAVSGPIRQAYRDDPDGMDDALVAEIAAVTGAMLYPDAEIGSL